MDLWNLKQALKITTVMLPCKDMLKTPFIHTVMLSSCSRSTLWREILRLRLAIVWMCNHRNWPILENNDGMELDVTKSGISLHAIISGMPWFSTCLYFTKCFGMLQSRWQSVNILCHYWCVRCSHTAVIICSHTPCRILKMIHFLKK